MSIPTVLNYLIIEKPYVGSDIQMTDIQIKVNFVSTTIVGNLGFATVTYDKNPLLAAKKVPVLVIPAGSFPNRIVHGIMGASLKQKVAAGLYLPYPYNQGFVTNYGASTITFGLIANFNGLSIPLQQINCTIDAFTPMAKNNCYNDNAIPIQYNFNGNKEVIPGIFDSGSLPTVLYLQSLPRGAIIDDNNVFISPLSASLYLNNQASYNLSLTTATRYPPVYNQQQPGERIISNLGYQIFYQNQIYFDPTNGLIAIKPL